MLEKVAKLCKPSSLSDAAMHIIEDCSKLIIRYFYVSIELIKFVSEGSIFLPPLLHALELGAIIIKVFSVHGFSLLISSSYRVKFTDSFKM